MSSAAHIQPVGGPIARAKDAPRLVARVPAVDAVGLEQRAAALATRSIKKD